MKSATGGFPSSVLPGTVGSQLTIANAETATAKIFNAFISNLDFELMRRLRHLFHFEELEGIVCLCSNLLTDDALPVLIRSK